MPLQTTTGKFGASLNPHVTLNGVDLSSFIRSVTLKRGAKVIDLTASGDTSEVKANSVKNWTLDIDFYQSYYSAEVDATLDPLAGGASFAVIVRPDQTAKATLNPEWTGNAILPDYTPLASTHGDELMAPVSIQGTGALTRAIA